MKKLDRSYHEYVVDAKRKKWDKVWFDKVVDAWNDISETYTTTIDDWKRLGYTDEEAKELVEASNIYK